MIGFALEGGGARGAYQVGAYLALTKNGIKPNMIAGTSIGSLNAALMAQGDIDKLIKLWLNTTTDIFGIDSKILEKLKHKDFTNKELKLTYNSLKNIIHNKGINTNEYFNIIDNSINEDKLRKSKVKFGLITVKLSGGIKPLELTIDNIPKDKVAEYILASCYLPVFKMQEIIDNNIYIDGGFYNNIPLSLLEKNGCNTIYSIRLGGIGIYRNKLKKDTKVIEIKPRKSLGQTIIFDRETNERNIRLGYFDTLKVIKNLDGIDYYFKSKNNEYYDKIIKNLNKNTLNKLRIRFRAVNSKELIIKIVEYLLTKNNVNKFEVLNIKYTIFKLRRTKIKDKTIKEFIDSCKLI